MGISSVSTFCLSLFERQSSKGLWGWGAISYLKMYPAQSLHSNRVCQPGAGNPVQASPGTISDPGLRLLSKVHAGREPGLGWECPKPRKHCHRADPWLPTLWHRRMSGASVSPCLGSCLCVVQRLNPLHLVSMLGPTPRVLHARAGDLLSTRSVLLCDAGHRQEGSLGE